MPEPILNRPAQRNGNPLTPSPAASPLPARSGPQKNGDRGAHVPGQEGPRSDRFLLEEMTRLSEANNNLLNTLSAARQSKDLPDAARELESLRAENEELRRTVAELEHLVESGPSSEADGWPEREKEYESLLEEKSEIIRSLHLKIQELQESQAQVPARPPAPPNEEELQAVCDELERERAQLDLERREIQEERAQLQDDEESLMKQMREMEMSMSRERAELARQRNDLQRLHNDIRHELELAARDASLRDRLVGLQRRHQDLNNRKGVQPLPEPPPAAPPANHAPSAAKGPPKKESGIFRRLFK
jgi:chromosome segregation ATPase